MRPDNPGWFIRTHLDRGRVIKDIRINRKGRHKGSKDREPRAVMMRCPRCGYRPGQEERRALKRLRRLGR